MLKDNDPDGRSSLDWIADGAEAHEASMLSKTDTTLAVVVRLRRADGEIIPYQLEVYAYKYGVKVKEIKPNRLPAGCPERHINSDGTFCTHWDRAMPLRITDSEAATLWWRQLLGYLKLQERAAYLREWPNRKTWAHGDQAAEHQRVAEETAEVLGGRFADALAVGRLKVKKSRANGGAFLALHDGAQRLYSIWRASRRVATQRQYCVCGSGLTFIDCQDHAYQAVELIEALIGWEKEERLFWSFVNDQPCCGTLDNCPLKKAA